MHPDDLLLPEETRLVHIGPPKTGTTSLQAAFWAARDEARRQGVHYAGGSRHSASAVLAVTGRKLPSTGAVPPIGRWTELLDEVRRTREPRVVISSEGFSYGRPEVVRRVVADLDPARVHVAVTLRPVTRIMTSVWQEQTQSGARVPFDEWLRAQLDPPPDGPASYLWRLHRHDRVIARWADVVGPDRLTAIVVDETDHGAVLGVFERLTGLRGGTLALVPDLANRSLTLPEIEAIIALSERFEAEGLARHDFHRIVRMEAAAYLKTRRPPPDEPRIEAPQWALDRAGEVAREIVDGIAASGVRVVGDLEQLAVVPRSRLEGDGQPEVPIPPDVTAWLAFGMYRAGETLLGIDRVPPRGLATGLARRVGRAARRRARGLRLRR